MIVLAKILRIPGGKRRLGITPAAAELPINAGLRGAAAKPIRTGAGLIVFCGLLAFGCATEKPASESFASVMIPGHSAEKIRETTVEVFTAAGFKAFRVPGGGLRFEKEGSWGEQIAYGGLGGAAYGAAVTMQVQAEIADVAGQDARRLQCTVYRVRNVRDGVFEDKQRLTNFRHGPYQKLLQEVARKLE